MAVVSDLGTFQVHIFTIILGIILDLNGHDSWHKSSVISLLCIRGNRHILRCSSESFTYWILIGA